MREATRGVLLRVPFRVVFRFSRFLQRQTFGSSGGQPDGKGRALPGRSLKTLRF